MGRVPRRTELLQGTLDMLVLKTLGQGPMHGYGIARAIRRASDQVLLVEEGSLYPALYRMERRGWLRSSWGTSENNRRAKYYELTDRGRKQVRERVRAWARLQAAIEQVLRARPGEAPEVAP